MFYLVPFCINIINVVINKGHVQYMCFKNDCIISQFLCLLHVLSSCTCILNVWVYVLMFLINALPVSSQLVVHCMWVWLHCVITRGIL